MFAHQPSLRWFVSHTIFLAFSYLFFISSIFEINFYYFIYEIQLISGQIQMWYLMITLSSVLWELDRPVLPVQPWIGYLASPVILVKSDFLKIDLELIHFLQSTFFVFLMRKKLMKGRKGSGIWIIFHEQTKKITTLAKEGKKNVPGVWDFWHSKDPMHKGGVGGDTRNCWCWEFIMCEGHDTWATRSNLYAVDRLASGAIWVGGIGATTDWQGVQIEVD